MVSKNNKENEERSSKKHKDTEEDIAGACEESSHKESAVCAVALAFTSKQQPVANDTEQCCSGRVIHASFKGCSLEGVATCFDISLERQLINQETVRNSPTYLCSLHYQRLYKFVSLVRCSICETIITRTASETVRLCSDPHVISKYLESSCGFEGTIGHNDPLCLSSYKWQLTILRVNL